MRFTRLLVLVCSVVLFVPAVSATATASASRWVLGYYVGYLHNAMPPAQVPWSAMTHIVVGPVTPRADGTLDTTLDIDATRGPALARQLAHGATSHGVTPMLMIGGAGAHDGFRAAMSTHPVAFENQLLQKLTAWGYAGLDLDWEPVNAADQPLISRLVSDLRTAMPGVVLTMPVGWVNTNFPGCPGLLRAAVDEARPARHHDLRHGRRLLRLAELALLRAARPDALDTVVRRHERPAL